MNELLEFLRDNNARVSYMGRWLITEKDEDNDDNCYTVYDKSYGRRKAKKLYEGYYLSTAIAFLKGDVE
jgi:hypothetical protein